MVKPIIVKHIVFLDIVKRITCNIVHQVCHKSPDHRLFVTIHLTNNLV